MGPLPPDSCCTVPFAPAHIFHLGTFFLLLFFLTSCEKHHTLGPPSQSAAFPFCGSHSPSLGCRLFRRTTYGTSVQHPSSRKTELLRWGPKPNARRIRAPSLVIASEQLHLGSNSPGVTVPLLFLKKIASVVVKYRELKKKKKKEQCFVEPCAKNRNSYRKHMPVFILFFSLIKQLPVWKKKFKFFEWCASARINGPAWASSQLAPSHVSQLWLTHCQKIKSQTWVNGQKNHLFFSL